MLQIYKFIVDKKTKGRSFMLFFCLMLATTVSLAQNGAKITIKKNSISVIEALKEVEKTIRYVLGTRFPTEKNKTGHHPQYRGGFVGKCTRSNSQRYRFHLSTEREIYHDYSGTKERKQPDQKDHR